MEHAREPATKPHEMSLNGDLTSSATDVTTKQHHLTAKSPMSDDSGVAFDEHRTVNGSLPITPEREETRWEAGQEATNGMWRTVRVEEGDKGDTGTAGEESRLADNVEEQVTMLEMARPPAEDSAGSRVGRDGDGVAIGDEDAVERQTAGVSETLPTEQQQQPPVVDKDKDRVDFVPGVHCDNVKDALNILKSKYRLPKPAQKKRVITFSCWNLKDITNTPTHEVSSTNSISQPPLTVDDDRHLIDILGEILTKEKEIDRLLEQVLEKERRVHSAEESMMGEQRNSVLADAADADNDWPVVDESLKATDVATVPLAESVPPAGQSEDGTKTKKQGRLARLIHALRRRFGRR